MPTCIIGTPGPRNDGATIDIKRRDGWRRKKVDVSRTSGRHAFVFPPARRDSGLFDLRPSSTKASRRLSRYMSTAGAPAGAFWPSTLDGSAE
jgi:hypothetical protein